MTTLTNFVAVVGLLGSALIAGVFFAFSSFIMKALAKLPSSEGIAAMQSINVVVLNRSFLGVFMGTSAVSLLIVATSFLQWEQATTMWFLFGGVLYFVGTFLVTAMGNVPLNNRLAALSATDTDSAAVWDDYLERWTRLNSVRAVAATAAAFLFILGLIGGTHV